MKKIKYLIIGLLLSTNLYASSTGSCWDIEQTAQLEFSELEENITFSFKDSKTCEPIANAKVEFAFSKMITNEFGEVSLPVPPVDIDAKFPLVVKKNGYITLKQKVQASVGSFLAK